MVDVYPTGIFRKCTTYSELDDMMPEDKLEAGRVIIKYEKEREKRRSTTTTVRRPIC